MPGRYRGVGRQPHRVLEVLVAVVVALPAGVAGLLPFCAWVSTKIVVPDPRLAVPGASVVK